MGQKYRRTPGGTRLRTPRRVRLICEDCGEKARARVPLRLTALGVAVLTATGWIVAVEGLVAMALFPAATTAVMGWGAVRMMKRANSRARRTLATGESPDYKALRAGPA